MARKIIDMSQSPRAGQFAYFSAMADPWAGATVMVDITDFLPAIREKGLPFFLSFLFAVTRAGNAVPELRRRLLPDGTVVEYDLCQPSYTAMKPDGAYVYVDVDGGITDSIPYKKAMDEGCDKNIVILTREIGYTKTTDRATAYAARKFRKYPEFSSALLHRADMYNRKVAELEELERRGKVFILRPDTTEGIARTESDPKVLRMLYDKGADLMRSRIGELRDYLAK